MEKPMRQDEMRLIIRPVDEPQGSARPIPARVFRKAFTTVLDGLKAANEELYPKKYRSEFFISHLDMGSNIVGFSEQRRASVEHLTPAIDRFRAAVVAVYRSEFGRVASSPKLTKSMIKIGLAIDPYYPCAAYFPTETIPLDSFFARQASRLGEAVSKASALQRHFSGNAIGSFDGRLGDIDYRGATWKGHLVLPGGHAQIECVFDREKGENEFNPFGNKRVSVTGRAIYTGDSQLPERIEVFSIEAIPLADESVDIRGSLTDRHYFIGWDRESGNLKQH